MKIERRTLAGAVMALLTLLMLGVAPGLAQQATPTPPPGSPPASSGGELPVAVHPGTCPQPTPEPEFTLTNTIVAGSEVAEAEVVGETPGPSVLASSSAADIALADLAGSPRVIAVHQSPDEFGTLVACGTIAGLLSDGTMTVSLQEVEGSGISGVAILQEDGDQTNISVYVLSPEAAPATPAAATPAS